MEENTKIFGYGSLMNMQSLKKTVPNIKAIRPVLLKNYIRCFETKSTTRFTKNITSISVLNIKESKDAFVNGVCFDVDMEYLNSLLKREGAYELRDIVVNSLTTAISFPALIFIDKSNKKQKFLFDEPVQIEYLKTCINGAKDFGEDFYGMFLETTLIDGYKLKDIKELNYLL